MSIIRTPVKHYKVFISGKYSDKDDPESIQKNTEQAKQVAIKLMQHGHTPVSHHLAFPDFGEVFSSETIIAHSLSLLADCDAIYFMEGHKKSSGSRWAFNYAEQNNIREIFDLDKFLKTRG